MFKTFFDGFSPLRKWSDIFSFLLTITNLIWLSLRGHDMLASMAKSPPLYFYIFCFVLSAANANFSAEFMVTVWFRKESLEDKKHFLFAGLLFILIFTLRCFLNPSIRGK